MEVIATALNALFPRSCVRCGDEGALFCSVCLASWPLTPPDPMTEHVAAFAYGNPVVRDLIRAWKYDFDFSAWHILRDVARGILPRVQQMLGSGTAAIVPIPLSAHRFRERGFNQAEEVARWLGQELNLPVIDALARRHSSTHQATLTTQARLELSKTDTFLLKSNISQSFSHFDLILIVDDVLTTGATVASARSILLENGSKHVVGFTLAKS